MAKGGIISAIHQGSLAEELELVPGDKIISINEQELTDIIDLSFYLLGFILPFVIFRKQLNYNFLTL